MLFACPVLAPQSVGHCLAQAPTKQQVFDMLSGNTMRVEWAGNPHTQFFDAGGNSRYREDGGGESLGRWRVNSSANYCSVWPPSDRWVCYQVLVDGMRKFLKSGDAIYPARVGNGNSFSPGVSVAG